MTRLPSCRQHRLMAGVGQIDDRQAAVAKSDACLRGRATSLCRRVHDDEAPPSSPRSGPAGRGPTGPSKIPAPRTSRQLPPSRPAARAPRPPRPDGGRRPGRTFAPAPQSLRVERAIANGKVQAELPGDQSAGVRPSRAAARSSSSAKSARPAAANGARTRKPLHPSRKRRCSRA